MKKYLLLIFITLCTNYAFSQAFEEQKFFGTWKWQNGNKQITLFLKYDTINTNIKSFPAVIGFHRFIRNDSVVQNFMPLYLPQYADYTSSSYIGGLDQNNVNLLVGTIKDEETNKAGRLYLTYISPNKLKFELMSLNGIQVGARGAAFSLPTGIIFTKEP